MSEEHSPSAPSSTSSRSGRTRTGLSLIAIAVAIVIAPFVVPDLFGGPLVAGWALMATLPIGAILLVTGMVAMVVPGGQTDETVAAGVAVSPIAELPRWFGVTQIGLMGFTFIVLLVCRIIFAMLGGGEMLYQALYLPDTIGVAVAGWLTLSALQLRVNPEKTWSARRYENLLRAQRVFTIPTVLSILFLSIQSPMLYFDDTSVGSAEGIAYNHTMGYITIAVPAVVTLACITSWVMGFVYTRLHNDNESKR